MSNYVLVYKGLVQIIVKGFLYFFHWHKNKGYLWYSIETKRKAYIINLLKLFPVDIHTARYFTGTPGLKRSKVKTHQYHYKVIEELRKVILSKYISHVR